MALAGAFGLLDGASPFWWIALALALGAIEIVIGTTYLLGPAAAAVTVAAALAVWPDLTGTMQITVFAVATIAYAGLGWAMFGRLRRREAEGPQSLNSLSARLVGRQAVAATTFTAGIGSVRLDGVDWRARLADGATPPEEGETVTVAEVDGATLVVERL